MKALSIRQPWAWMILHAGKNIENRDWQTSGPNMRAARALVLDQATILIHASAGMTRSEYEDCLDMVHIISLSYPFPEGMVLPAFEELPRGGIVGSVKMIDVVQQHPSPWFTGPYGLLLRDPKPLLFREMKGQLGFFEVPDV